MTNSTTQTTYSRTFLEDVLHGLSSHPRSLPCKYFYDEHGSQLFDQICELDEYYLTRVELEIMEQYADEMAIQIDQGVMLVEYGSGSSIKTRILLDHLDDPVAYVPVDISEDHLLKTAAELQEDYPNIEILPVVADFSQSFPLPRSRRPATHAVFYFPGSTIGNFERHEADELISKIARQVGPGGGLLIGIDLHKKTSILEAAYNDRKGITAEFNLNLLRRINNELDGNFNLKQFEHCSVYNSQRQRIETSLVSRTDQTVSVAGQEFEFEQGEEIHTEYSHKYTIEGFAEQARKAGQFELHRFWTDPRQRFAVLHLVVEENL